MAVFARSVTDDNIDLDQKIYVWNQRSSKYNSFCKTLFIVLVLLSYLLVINLSQYMHGSKIKIMYIYRDNQSRAGKRI